MKLSGDGNMMNFRFNLDGVDLAQEIFVNFISQLHIPLNQFKIQGALNYFTKEVVLTHPAPEVIDDFPLQHKLTFSVEWRSTPQNNQEGGMVIKHSTSNTHAKNLLSKLGGILEYAYAFGLDNAQDEEQNNIPNEDDIYNNQSPGGDNQNNASGGGYNLDSFVNGIMRIILSGASNVPLANSDPAPPSKPLLKPSGPTFTERLEKINCELEEDKYNDFYCPITKCIMEDPVAVSSGKSYDRVGLEGYFNAHSNPEKLKCPVTNLPIWKRELNNNTNSFLKNQIEKIVAEKEKEAQNPQKIPAPVNNKPIAPPVTPKPQTQNLSLTAIKPQSPKETKPALPKSVIPPIITPPNNSVKEKRDEELRGIRMRECLALINPLLESLDQKIKTTSFATQSGKAQTELLLLKLKKYKDVYAENLYNGVDVKTANQKFWNKCNPRILKTKEQLKGDMRWYSYIANFFRQLANALIGVFASNSNRLFVYTQSPGLALVENTEKNMSQILLRP